MTYKRTDANQACVVRQLRLMGCTVQTIHTVGKGCPDLLIGFRGRNFLVELKDVAKTPSQKKLTHDEKLWHDRWRGQVGVFEDADEIYTMITNSFL